MRLALVHSSEASALLVSSLVVRTEQFAVAVVSDATINCFAVCLSSELPNSNEVIVGVLSVENVVIVIGIVALVIVLCAFG